MSATASQPGGSPGRVAIKVWVDFVCPFCLLMKGPLREAVEGLDVDIEWLPYELRPEPTPTLRPEDEYLPGIWATAVYPMARRMGVRMKLPTISPQPYTRLAFEGFQHARHHGKGQQYVDAVLNAFFQADQDIGRADVLKAIAAAIGLSPENFSRDLHEGRYRQDHVAALQAARDVGISVVPTLMVGARRVEGVPSAAALRQAIQSELGNETHLAGE